MSKNYKRVLYVLGILALLGGINYGLNYSIYESIHVYLPFHGLVVFFSLAQDISYVGQVYDSWAISVSPIQRTLYALSSGEGNAAVMWASVLLTAVGELALLLSILVYLWWRFKSKIKKG